jgi:hypothetical protein
MEKRGRVQGSGSAKNRQQRREEEGRGEQKHFHLSPSGPTLWGTAPCQCEELRNISYNRNFEIHLRSRHHGMESPRRGKPNPLRASDSKAARARAREQKSTDGKEQESTQRTRESSESRSKVKMQQQNAREPR